MYIHQHSTILKICKACVTTIKPLFMYHALLNHYKPLFNHDGVLPVRVMAQQHLPITVPRRLLLFPTGLLPRALGFSLRWNRWFPGGGTGTGAAVGTAGGSWSGWELLIIRILWQSWVENDWPLNNTSLKLVYFIMIREILVECEYFCVYTLYKCQKFLKTVWCSVAMDTTSTCCLTMIGS